MIAPRRLALNCIRPLQEFSRHYRVPRKAPTLRETPASWAETETARFGRLRFSICDAHSGTHVEPYDLRLR
ncbi:hypothetical protein V1477_003051 [Vespula maculifrons]|uniref:Uncharacterized protein n=1 Tax=Vespula maculifrons TaxID=7453 RepID=A0ABD2CTF1_VESMC